MDKLVRFSVTMESTLLNRFDALVASRGVRVNRSEAIRDLVREALVEDATEDPDALIAGTVTLVFDHHDSGLLEKLTAIQHHYIQEIVSTVHVHLDSNHCLEVIVLRGANSKIGAIANTLLGTKGVQHGKLVTTVSGNGACEGETAEHHHAQDYPRRTCGDIEVPPV